MKHQLIPLGLLLGLLHPLAGFASPSSARPGDASDHQKEIEVFNALDLNRPELSAVSSSWRMQDFAGTEKALASYLRSRTFVRWGQASQPNYGTLTAQDRVIADNAVQGKLQGGMVPLIYSFPHADVDWHFNATYHLAGQTPNNEWQWQMNRFQFWGSLAKAYRASHDEQYAMTFEREMRSWIVQCRVPSHVDNIPGSPWRTIEAGIRIGGPWPEAFFAFRNSPSLTDTDLIVFLAGFLDHGRYLRANNTRLNFLTMEMSGLYAVGALFPEFQEASDWRSYAVGRLTEEIQRQFLPDGAQVELSTGYQNVALDYILKVQQIAIWTGRISELPSGYSAPLEQAYEYQVGLMTPDRLLPKINNSWPIELPQVFRRAAELFPHNEQFKWVATDTKLGNPPRYTSIFFNRAGIADMRSGWTRQDNDLVFRVGPLGMGHMHQDKLGVMLWAYGRELIFNGGGGSYEKSKWRDWAQSTFAANSEIVDGLAQSRVPNWEDPFHDPNMISQVLIDAHWQSTPVFDFASGRYDDTYGPKHLKPASVKRSVLFLKPDVYVVVDLFTPNDTKVHDYQIRWQIKSTSTKLDKATHEFATTDPGIPNVVILPLPINTLVVQAVSGQESPEILGWDIRKDVTPDRVPATTLLQNVSGIGPQTIINLLVPLHPGQLSPVAHVEPGSGASLPATVVFADGRRLFVQASGRSGVAVTEKLADGTSGRAVVVDP